MDNELKLFLTQIAERQDGRMDAIDARLTAIDAKIEKVETTLLTEFHKWASPVDAKLRTHRSWFTEIDAELQLLKARLDKLEGGKPPRSIPPRRQVPIVVFHFFSFPIHCRRAELFSISNNIPRVHLRPILIPNTCKYL